MLRRSLRLSLTQDFDRVYQKGEQLTTRNLRVFRLRAGPRQNQNQTRFGFVVSKKQGQGIAQRNRIKRMLRNLVFLNLRAIPKGSDYVFLAKRGIERASFEELNRDVIELFRKLKQK